MALNKVTVSWCMVVWCTHNLRRDGSIFTWQPSLFAGRQQGCDTHCCSFIVCCKTARVCHPLLQLSLFAARQQWYATHCCRFHCLLQDSNGMPPAAAAVIVWCKTARVCHPLLQFSLFAARQQGCATYCCSFHCLLQDSKGMPPIAAVFIVCCKTARVCHPLLQFSLFAARQQRCASLWLKNIRQCHHVCWRFRWLTLWHPNHRLLTCSQIRHKAPVSLVHLVPQFQSIGKRANRSRLTTLLTSFLKTIDKTSVLCLAARLMKLRYLRCGLMSVGLPFFS